LCDSIPSQRLGTRYATYAFYFLVPILCMGMNSEGSAFYNNRGRASVTAFPVRDWERGMMYDS
ncbi:hypothetical protein, partial [Aphanizomenon flos-aquae]|uniref:hypothetical protein n=1 Tax=Aphanizomenon flos-aquae TaxID=1176 RepID=UPI001A7E3A08